MFRVAQLPSIAYCNVNVSLKNVENLHTQPIPLISPPFNQIEPEKLDHLQTQTARESKVSRAAEADRFYQ